MQCVECIAVTRGAGRPGSGLGKREDGVSVLGGEGTSAGGGVQCVEFVTVTRGERRPGVALGKCDKGGGLMWTCAGVACSV